MAEREVTREELTRIIAEWHRHDRSITLGEIRRLIAVAERVLALERADHNEALRLSDEAPTMLSVAPPEVKL